MFSWQEAESVLWLLLDSGRGEEHAVSSCVLEATLDVGERDVRRLITHLRLRHRKPILSSAEGYYLPLTFAEAERCAHSFRRRALLSLKLCGIFLDQAPRDLVQGILFDLEHGPLLPEEEEEAPAGWGWRREKEATHGEDESDPDARALDVGAGGRSPEADRPQAAGADRTGG
jgi:hypothetical protein